MTSPKATDVCKRFWMSPLPYFAIILMIMGAVGAISTLVIGYYMVYRSELQLGLCFLADYPGIRRACILDLGGGVMSMVVGVLLLLIEFASAYINRKDWKITFFVIKIVIASLTAIELVAGTIQGAASYDKYCDQDQDYYSSDSKLCDFSNDESQHDRDVDFLTIVIVTGIAASSWIGLVVVEVIRLCISFGTEASCNMPGNVINSGNMRTGQELRQQYTVDHELPSYNDITSPKHSAV